MDSVTARRQPRASVQAPPAVAVTVVVPVFNAKRYLAKTLPALHTAARRVPGVELVLVDNGSTDGSYEELCALDGVRVLRREGTIGAVRNAGARRGTGGHIAFLDADCLVAEDYFERALAVVGTTGAAATGCEVQLPMPAHWIEATWDHLHYVGRDRWVHYLNSANFFVARDAFEAVGGFDEELPTGEDAEIGRRLTEAGYRIFESTAVAAVHLGNPRSVRQFYRRSVWHALGMFGTVGGTRLDKPTGMMAAHLLASIAGVALLASPSAPRFIAALALQLAVPAATVAFRFAQTRRPGRIIQSIALYWLYYWARIYALALIVARRRDAYRK